MNKKHKKILNSIESFLILVSAISGCFSVSAFTSLVGILKDIMSSEVEFKSQYLRKKKRERAYNIVSKTTLNTIEVLNVKALVDLSISHHTFFGK